MNPGTLSPDIDDTAYRYNVSFKGNNKVPTLTMYMYSELGENNYSHNPSFITAPRIGQTEYSKDIFFQKPVSIKKTNKSPYSDHEEEFENTTYLSKIGIYDKDKNLIAIVSLSNPVRKTEKRDFIFKASLDF